jgi:hypothetical protein
MKQSHAPTGEVTAEQRYEAERDRVEYSPAQPLGPDRIDDDGATPSAETVQPHVKSERAGRLKSDHRQG